MKNTNHIQQAEPLVAMQVTTIFRDTNLHTHFSIQFLAVIYIQEIINFINDPIVCLFFNLLVKTRGLRLQRVIFKFF